MTEKILVATYNDDLPQFEVMAYCLNKNWRGNPRITIVFGKPNPKSAHLPENINTVKEIVDRTFDSRWTIDIIDGVIPNMPGYHEQQVNKIRYSLDTDTIVFDSKDFLLKPADLDFFKPNGQYRVGYFNSTRLFIEHYPNINTVVDGISAKTPTTFITTPWIWPSDQVQKYWDYLQQKFGHYTSWETIPGNSEWAGYFAYTWNDPESLMPMTSNEYEFVNFGGVWQSTDLNAIQEQLDQFDLWPERRIWKHNRKVMSVDTMSYTAQVLSKYNIDQTIIDQWVQQHTERMHVIDICH